MKKLLSGAVALAALGWTLSAQAADMNYGARAPYTVNQPLNAYSWAGPYLGVNLGYAWGSVHNNPTEPSGLVGGVQAGYNWQTGAFVWGVETDFQLSGGTGNFRGSRPGIVVIGTADNEWFGTIRGRLGYAVDRWLFSGNRNLVHGVFVGGERVVAEGRHRDRDAIAARYRDTMRRLLA